MSSSEIVWPCEDSTIIENILGKNISLMKEKFGALSQDSNNLYSRICVGNSLMSVESFRGCPLSCKYCMANNDVRSLKIEDDKIHNEISDISTVFVRKPERLFPTIDLVKALVKHPAFIKNKTVIGFGTGSTEFFLPEVGDDFWNGLEYLSENDYKNPIWIVVKSYLDIGNEKKWIKRFDFLNKKNIKVIVSISDIGASEDIEPYQANRFQAFDFLADSHVVISHHLRPYIPNSDDLEKSLYVLLSKSKDLVESVCVGGLRIDPGMLLFWDKAKELNENSIPGAQNKIFDKKIYEIVERIICQEKWGLPVFTKSSQMISHHLKIPDFNLYKYRKSHDSLLQIPIDQLNQIESKISMKIENYIKNIADSIKLTDLSFENINGSIYVNRALKYQEHNALIHAIGFSEVLA
jgi:DNA repair photolyase